MRSSWFNVAEYKDECESLLNTLMSLPVLLTAGHLVSAGNLVHVVSCEN